MRKTKTPAAPWAKGAAALVLAALLGRAAAGGEDGWISLGPGNGFAAWRAPVGEWFEAGDAALDPKNPRRLVGKPGTGVMINGPTGRTRSLVTKRTFQDVEVHLEFMLAKGSNSGLIFHGNYEIQILDSHRVARPTAAHCGGIYPRAEAEPTYHYVDGGVPPRTNAARPPGQWQTLEVVFQSPRFDAKGKKTANARFVKVVLNGQTLYENQEVPYPSGLNWRRKEFPAGPIILQGDYGPIAFRRVRVRPWRPSTGKAGGRTAARPLNAPPPGFTALFNGKDFTGWRLSPLARRSWTIENGVLKTSNPIDRWGADLATEKTYRDFVLLFEFRMPEISDSGINFRWLIPEIPGFGRQEQFNLRSKGGMGHLESFYFMPPEVKKRLGLTEADLPHVPHIDPEVGVWHRVKLAVVNDTVTAEYDGRVILDHFRYPKGVLSPEPAPIRFQKHIRTEIAGQMRDCPIEFRNIFIKEIKRKGTAEGKPPK